MEQLINITDATFLGHVGEIELGASAIAGIYYLAIYMLGFGFSIGLQVMIARKNGEQDYQETGKIFFQGLFFLMGLALFLYLTVHIVSPVIFKRSINSPEIYQAIIRYLDWRSLGLLFSFPFLAIRSFLVGITYRCNRDQYSSQLLPDIHATFRHIRSGYRFFTGRRRFFHYLMHLYVDENRQNKIWFTDSL